MAFDIINNEEIEYLGNRDSINVFLFMKNINKDFNNEIDNLFKNKGFTTINIYHNQFVKDEESLNYIIGLNLNKKITPFIMLTHRKIRKAPIITNHWECVYIWFFYKWIRVYRHDVLLL
ncbi:hypothetical protein F7018_17635 [Tenacibaculum aiptasiae]|uniref:Uncharacterized protein n=1 Tax=Tenacibaculum aiptasiae TaxID=426481 RepID=A0A7J5A7Q5_9FLAO|nr:hypothetical protein [Tenacibaculum aiptasiae]KAB1153169.1 hypothetical protein F7018_17635 [Tenacibaculum aiptasiae]